MTSLTVVLSNRQMKSAVPSAFAQQLKEPTQLDGWLRDGSAAYVEGLAEWT